MKQDANRTGDDPGTWKQPRAGDGGLDEPPKRPPTPPEPGKCFDTPKNTRPDLISSSGEAAETGSGATGDDDRTTLRDEGLAGPEVGGREWDTDTVPIFEKDRVVFGKYRLIEKIGEGGMGEVWRVWHVNLEAERALKLIKPELAQNDKGWRRFQREARLMAKINHPNAVAVYDFRRTQIGRLHRDGVRPRPQPHRGPQGTRRPADARWTGPPRSSTSSARCSRRRTATPTRRPASPRPIIHRDLKPSNLMLVERKGDTGRHGSRCWISASPRSSRTRAPPS